MVLAIAGHLPAHHSAVVFVAAGLGLRPGEAFDLEISAVDFLRRSVTVQRQLARGSPSRPCSAGSVTPRLR